MTLSNPPNDLSDRLQTLFIQQDELEQSQECSEGSELQMPRPRPFTPRSSSEGSIIQISPHRYSENPIITKTPPRLHSESTTPLINALPMTRAHSSPIFFSPSLPPPAPRSTSPLRSPKRVHSPFRHSSVDEGYLGAGGSSLSPEIISISEDAELEITPRNTLSTPLPYASLTFPRPLRRRPASPLRVVNNVRAASVPASPHFPAVGSVSMSSGSSTSSGKFNEAFPSDLPYFTRSISQSSSVPSTPTSTRSRSPSISSLETIPDSPDAEILATEEDEKDREQRRQLWELYGSGNSSGGSLGGAVSVGGGPRGFVAGRDKRKRWSVCGAEKRSDLNLETIWED
jgi:hypothetical protein